MAIPRFIILLLIILLTGCNKDIKRNVDDISQSYLDSVEHNIEKYIKKGSESKIRNGLLSEAEFFTKKITEDSIRVNAFFTLSDLFYEEDDSIKFREYNTKTLKLSKQLNDTSKIAESHWDLAKFLSGHNRIDSAFFHYKKAQNYYLSVGNSYYVARMLLNMAIIQKNIKDYTGSEIATFRSIVIFKSFENNIELYSAYNNLGIISNELEEYEKALLYHGKAKEYLSKTSKKAEYSETTLNNIGVVYLNKGDYLNAEINFIKALGNSDIHKRNARLYAMLLDNLAYSRMLRKDTTKVLELLNKALLIRRNINHKSGIVVNKLHLSEYFSIIGDSLKAKSYVLEAISLAKKTNNFGDLQKSLLMLSTLDKSSGEEILKNYIRLTDSLHNEERAIRNKFTRIRFETNEFIAQNEQLNFQNRWIILSFSGLVFILISVSIIIIQRKKNRELILIQQQLKSNEEIYNLLIDSQTKIEEGREIEKNRISQELHDGVSSQLYGIRLNLESLNNKSDPASLIKREGFLEVMRKLEGEIRTITHDLKMNFFSSHISFSKILEDLIIEQENIGKFKGGIIVDEKFKWDELTSKVKINLFRIIQEAIHNINKYAEAKKVDVIFERKDENVFLTIRDDGKGFDPKTNTTGIGINNMKSRVNDLNGQFTLSSGEEWTSIEIKVPVNKK